MPEPIGVTRTKIMPIEILLVEDNPLDIELTLHALKTEKLENHLIIARDGEEALDLLKRIKRDLCDGIALPRLILLDLNLPKVNGLDVLRHIKTDPVLKLIPTVILTSSMQQEDLLRCYDFAANSYLQKPVDFGNFRLLIKELGMYWLVANQMPSLAAAQELHATISK